ncbi:MAG TPA: alpha/beta hydrolase [Verrucomicrobiae bacterium]|nr:alpha/beta hydrolase [Verrucomicrobiae bacterium]
MSEQNQAINFRSLYPRLLSFGIGYGDLERITKQVNDWPSFSRAMADMGEHWDHMADKAYKSGCLETPRQHCLRAAAYFHYAQLRLHDSLMKEGLRRASRRAYEKYATLADPPIIRCEIPFQSMTLPGYLRVRKPGPCVILIGGLDSAKEVELHHFAEVFFNRCCSVFYFDGPGQGELYGRSSMAIGFENAVSSVIKFLSSDPRAQAGTVGCFGVSFGGYLACLSSAANPRVSACISIGGFFDHRILPNLPPVAAGTVRTSFGLPSGANMNELNRYITLEPQRGNMKAPLLIVHGTADHLVDAGQIHAMKGWAAGPVETMVLEGSEHVCSDRFNKCLPLMGDWMASWLLHKNESVAVI